MNKHTSSESRTVEEFDYESLWALMDKRKQNRHHIQVDDSFNDEPIEHPIIAPERLPRAHQDRFVLEMDDDEYEAYREFIGSYIANEYFAPLQGINEKEYKLKLSIRRDSKGNREIEVHEVGFRDKARHKSWFPKPDLEEIDGQFVDVSAFNTHDYARTKKSWFDKESYKIRQLQKRLKDLLLTFTTIQNMSKMTYENLRARILSAYDEIKELRRRRAERARKAREAAFDFKQR